MLAANIQAEIEQYLKRKIVSFAPLSAANNAEIYRMTMDDRSFFVAKVAARGLDIESYMLKYLKEKSKLPVPTVFYSNEHVMIMEYVESYHGIDEPGQRNAAEMLTSLHEIHADSYGFERDTLIGSLHQPNPQMKDWVKFYTEHRLLYMAREALKESKIDASLMKQIEKLAGKLPNYIKTPNPPSLIHGDIWTGNILPGRECIVAFLDPAIYYADPEIELAFIRQLNTFNATFFDRYNEISPIKAGFFEERADIYGLYYLLVYTRIFGTSYARKAQKAIARFV